MREKPSPDRQLFSRRGFVKTVSTGMGAAVAGVPRLGKGMSQPGPVALDSASLASPSAFKMRACFEDLTLHYWFWEGAGTEAGPPEVIALFSKGRITDARFWDKQGWERFFKGRAEESYNAVIYGPSRNLWAMYLIRHKEFPEAQELTPDVQEPIIAQMKWIFSKGHEYGFINLMANWQLVTSNAFAKAHGWDKPIPESAEVSSYHNGCMTSDPNRTHPIGPGIGIRNELTRAFTEAATLELLQTYPDLDGFYGEMGEALPGKRSTWYGEAIVPGMKRSGRNPLYVVQNWMMPREDFIHDIVRPNIYPNTWLAVMPNGEMFTDPKPYPDIVKWAEDSGVPTVMGIHMHNYEGGFPYNSPKLAYEMVNEFKRVANCAGFSAQMSDNPNHLFRKGLAYYGSHLDEPYSDDRWVAILEERFGDREAARHILNAYNLSARICPEVCAQFWHNTDGHQGRHLHLSYLYLTERDPRYFGWYTSPVRGSDLIPIRRYAQIVGKFGSRYRDNSGGDYTRPPYSQQMIFGPADYQNPPEEQMRKIRRLGGESLREAELALETVKKNRDEAKAIYNYMKGYKLLTDYYEQKVLAGISALIYGLGGPKEEKAQAEKLADDTLKLYQTANSFIWENIDMQRGEITTQWQGKTMKLPDLMEYERQERAQLATLFNWPTA